MAKSGSKPVIIASMTECRARFSELVDFVAAGGEVVITKRGIPVVRMIAVKKLRR